MSRKLQLEDEVKPRVTPPKSAKGKGPAPARSQLKLFLLTQTKVVGYDTYDSCVVVAQDPESAKRIHPSDYVRWSTERNRFERYYGERDRDLGQPADGYDWPLDPDDITVEYLGLAAMHCVEGVVIIASFNAG